MNRVLLLRIYCYLITNMLPGIFGLKTCNSLSRFRAFGGTSHSKLATSFIALDVSLITCAAAFFYVIQLCWFLPMKHLFQLVWVRIPIDIWFRFDSLLNSCSWLWLLRYFSSYCSISANRKMSSQERYWLIDRFFIWIKVLFTIAFTSFIVGSVLEEVFHK